CSVGTFKINDLMPASRTLCLAGRRYAPAAIVAVPLVGMSVPMSLPQTTSGYGLGPDEGDPLWFNGGRAVVKATVDQTQGRYAALEMWARKGFAAPLHIHHNEDEFFIVMSGEVRVRHGDEVIEAVPGSFVYGPRGVPHSFHIDSEEAKILLLFGPGGVEGFFR
ncbi:MAG: cupin domain-containing protein, partial [Sporichthyaceae bacterium]